MSDLPHLPYPTRIVANLQELDFAKDIIELSCRESFCSLILPTQVQAFTFSLPRALSTISFSLAFTLYTAF